MITGPLQANLAAFLTNVQKYGRYKDIKDAGSKHAKFCLGRGILSTFV